MDKRTADSINEQLENELETLSDIRIQCGEIGLPLDKLYTLNRKEYDEYFRGYMTRKQNDANTCYNMYRYLAANISLAVFDANKFNNTKVPYADFADRMDPHYLEKKIRRRQEETLKRIEKQYGIDLRNRKGV